MKTFVWSELLFELISACYFKHQASDVSTIQRLVCLRALENSNQAFSDLWVFQAICGVEPKKRLTYEKTGQFIEPKPTALTIARQVG